MKKSIMISIVALFTTTCFASDYIQQEVTSEVYTEKVETYQTYQQPIYQQRRIVKPMRYSYNQNYNLKPITVHTGRTVTVQDHYDVYQPRIVYDKVDSYTTTKTCTYCN